MNAKLTLTGIFFTAALLAGSSSAHAADPYPSKPVKIIFGFPAASATDVIARAIGQKLSDKWSQPVIIDNRPGAGGNLGSEVAARQPADGYTGNPSSTGNAVPPIQGPQVIRQAQLAISVKSGEFDSKLTAVRALVQLEQGYIAGTDAQVSPANANDQIRTGVVTFMVPVAKFDDAISQLSQLGKVQNVHISGNDVSAQYVDLQARLGNLEAQRNAMLALLGRA